MTTEPEAADQQASRNPANAPVRFAAFGKAGDGKLFTTAIRAFALAGKLGDRLVLHGFGRRRPRLVKWATALGVDAVVDFADHAGDLAPLVIDVAIFLSAPDPEWQSTWSSRCRADMRVIGLVPRRSGGRLPALVDRAVPAGDVLALSTAMLSTAR